MMCRWSMGPLFIVWNLRPREFWRNLGVDYGVDEKEVGKFWTVLKGKALIWMITSVKQFILLQAMGFVITSGQYRGKTTTINAIIKYLEYEGMEMRLAAPTGKAAKTYQRQQDVRPRRFTGCCVIGGPDDDRLRTQFERNQENPLKQMWSLLMRCPWWIFI